MRKKVNKEKKLLSSLGSFEISYVLKDKTAYSSFQPCAI
jgi:hypothetical protein